jgi:Pyruvate/2-oxoacid:ferredoxin oxidoreductase gamma subunit
VILLTVYSLVTGAIALETLQKVIPLSIKRKNLVDINMKAINAGISWYQENGVK